MTKDDQILRLICTGVAFFGLLANGGMPHTPPGLLALCDNAVKTGRAMFDTAKKCNIWPITESES